MHRARISSSSPISENTFLLADERPLTRLGFQLRTWSYTVRTVVTACLISSFALFVPHIVRAGEKPKESLSLNFGKIQYTYKQQNADGGESHAPPPPPPKPSIKGPSVHPTINVHPTISTVKVR
jgi:hypothetical protein